MDELLNKAVRAALFVIAALIVIWLLIPEGRTVSAGFGLGMLASVANAYLLRRRVEFIGELAARQHGAGRRGAGIAGRVATVLLAAMTAVRFPDLFALPAVLAGSFFVQISVLIAAIVQKKGRTDGKG